MRITTYSHVVSTQILPKGCPRLVIQYDPDYFHMHYKCVFCGSYYPSFVVCLLLYAVLLLQDVFACTVRVAHVYMCVGRGTDPQIGLGQ